MAEAIWDKEIDVPMKWIEFVDDNVLAKLPEGTRVISIGPHGNSYWTRTAEIQTEQADGTPLSFFLKVTQNEAGKGMVSGEFVSMSALHDVVPDITPKPVGWGTYASDSNTHFFLCSFVDMTDDIPDIKVFPAKIAELHRKSLSPNRKYGFSVPTYQGRLPQAVDWQDSWEVFFSNLMRRILQFEEESQGPDEELSQLSEALFSKVIPRLLRPLETGGRQIQPRLVHGDMWDGNTSTNVTTNLPVIFDATCFYGHSESRLRQVLVPKHADEVVDLAPWRPERHKMSKPYIKAYFKHFPESEPAVDRDDRNALYTLRFNTVSSALYPGNLRFRNIILKEMRYLVEKYPDGYEGWAKENGELPAEQPKPSENSEVLVAEQYKAKDNSELPRPQPKAKENGGVSAEQLKREENSTVSAKQLKGKERGELSDEHLMTKENSKVLVERPKGDP